MLLLLGCLSSPVDTAVPVADQPAVLTVDPDGIEFGEVRKFCARPSIENS